jgi:hypothetical protein
MKSINEKLGHVVAHLEALDKTFITKSNYSNNDDYLIYKQNHEQFEKLSLDVTIKQGNLKIGGGHSGKKIDLSFADEIYHQQNRQLKLADIIEYLFFSRGIYYIFQSNSFKKDRVSIFLKLILRYVNLLMIYECATVDKKLRDSLLKNLDKLIKSDHGYQELSKWKDEVGLPRNHPKYNSKAPDEYFDSIMPKTAGGLWHEMLVFAFILKYNIGYIFPMLLIQKPISLEGKLSPPDLIILHRKTYRYYGIEIGSLKERQSGGFMAPSGIPIIPIDTLNTRISDRCPTCSKWIGICEKVIEDFSSTSNTDETINEVRCLVDCQKFSLTDKLNGKCPYIKFKYNSKIDGKKYPFSDNKHHHYKCCIKKDKTLITSIKNHAKFSDLKKFETLQKKQKKTQKEKLWCYENYQKLKSSFNFIKTHSVYYQELSSLIEINNTIG